MAHIPVLMKESLEALQLKAGGTYVDCTVNRGGHSSDIAKAIGPSGRLICIDLDQGALAEAKERIEKLQNAPTLNFVHSNFRHLQQILGGLEIGEVDGVLADLGISSQELDESGRGFSFQNDEPLQMTFDDKPTDEQVSAYDIVNTWSESSIADILYGFADETYARRIARKIVENRDVSKIATTSQLVDIIASAVPSAYRHKKTHFATKTFQALRMAVNDELGSIHDLIEALPVVLRKGGRAAIITFHSTEDRIVKQGLRFHADTLSIINKKAIVPTEEELQTNPRARSAQLRIAEKI
jgi:16S rRNA (cytosine1402-N4)-methyltransferase